MMLNRIKTATKGEFSYLSFTFLMALYFTLVVNLPVYKELLSIFTKLDTVKIGFAISIPLFFLAALNLIFNLLSWPWLSKPLFALLLIVSSMVSYAGYNYGTLFDYSMIANIFETDSSEASSYFSTYSLVWTLLMGIIPAIWVLRVKLTMRGSFIRMTLHKLAMILASVLAIGVIAALYYQDYASVGRNNSYLK